MSAPIPPYVQRRLDFDKSCYEKGHALLAESVRGLSHLTDEERRESERLISLPYGAEGFGLRRFSLRNFRVEAA